MKKLELKKNVKTYKTMDDYESYQSRIYHRLCNRLKKEVLHRSFTRKDFATAVSGIVTDLTKGKVTVDCCWDIEPQTMDFEVTVVMTSVCKIGSDTEPLEYDFGFIDTYYLKHRRNSEWGDHIYITEFAINAD